MLRTVRTRGQLCVGTAGVAVPVTATTTTASLLHTATNPTSGWLRPPRDVAALEQALRPQFVNGKWRGAKIGGRQAALLRREAELLGTNFPAPPRERKPRRPLRFKGHKADREKPERLLEIQRRLAEQDEKIAAHRAKERARRTRKGVDLILWQTRKNIYTET